MTITLITLLLVAMAATAYVLLRGVLAMASGGGALANGHKQSWMRKRVQYQAIAIMLVTLILVVAGGTRN